MMLVLMVASCTSLNCPLNNTTYTKYKLMGDVKTLNATLTISTTKQEGEDSVLINKDENVDSFILPMSLLPQNNRSEDNPQLYRLNSYQQ